MRRIEDLIGIALLAAAALLMPLAALAPAQAGHQPHVAKMARVCHAGGAASCDRARA